MRIGLYGGSFDPVHYGHLWVAEEAREKLQLDQVRFIPTAVSPLKARPASASDRQRIEMLELALGGNENFVIDDRELKRGGVSYTVDTLREMANEFPDASLFLILGADSLNDLERWKDPSEICRLATLAVVTRGGTKPPDWSVMARFAEPERVSQAREAAIETALIEISSRELRKRIGEGRSIRYRVPRGVELLIQNGSLYRTQD